MPDSVQHLAGLYCEVLLSDAIHKLNCGGFVLWRAMIFDDSGIGRSVFYALLTNESGASNCRAINAMKEM